MRDAEYVTSPGNFWAPMQELTVNIIQHSLTNDMITNTLLIKFSYSAIVLLFIPTRELTELLFLIAEFGKLPASLFKQDRD